MSTKYTRDIISQVYVDHKSIEIIYAVLNEFIPGFEHINVDYAGKVDEPDYIFSTENEMIRYYIDTPNVTQSFYWNKYKNNTDMIMVGVNITNDNKMVISLTFNGTDETEAFYHLKLKKFLHSDIGMISYIDPADYNSGHDFKEKYKDTKYDFE